MTDFNAALDTFTAALQKVLDAQNGTYKHYGKLKLMVGSKFIRVVRTNGNNEGGSVTCFVCKATGEVLKAEGWKKPSMLPRGVNITIPESYEGKMDAHGSWLYAR
jgi:hypothetical protein